jgi:hypothetical protein
VLAVSSAFRNPNDAINVWANVPGSIELWHQVETGGVPAFLIGWLFIEIDSGNAIAAATEGGLSRRRPDGCPSNTALGTTSCSWTCPDITMRMIWIEATQARGSEIGSPV